MRNCVRCGKEIDVISKDPEKVFFCKKCSLEALKINEEELFKEEKRRVKDPNYLLFALLPGTMQLQMKEYLKSFLYMYITYFLPLAWFVFFLLIYSLDEKVQLLIDGVRYYSIFVVLQVLIAYMKNAVEVKSEVNRVKSDI